MASQFGNIDDLKEDILEKVSSWETEMATFFGEWEEMANAWRMIPRTSGDKRPRGLFNSRSGETARAARTLRSLHFRMLTAADPFFMAVSEGTDDFGREITEEDLFGIEALTSKQLQSLKFKKKLAKSLNSVDLFGSAVVEKPFVSLPRGFARKSMEYTDFVHRSLLRTGFNPFMPDIEMSDYIFTIDFPTSSMLRNWSSQDDQIWDREAVEESIKEEQEGTANRKTDTFSRIQARKQRAGYNILRGGVHELITYHGRLNHENAELQRIWETSGRPMEQLAFTDWTAGILNGSKIVRLHPTPYGSWHEVFGVTGINEFEEEPIGYGAGKSGQRLQRELDITQSRMQDILMFSLYNMWKVGRFSGLKPNQLTIKPWNIIQLDQPDQLEAIRPQIEAIAQALNVMGNLKEDFRTTTGATANLQALITKATATEASITQTEAIRGASVDAEIIAETFIREYLETMHLNNTNLLDSEIWVQVAGTNAPRPFSKLNIPRSVGFQIKTTTDKDFRPERLQRLLEFMQLATSIRNVLPNGVNVEPFFEEWARGLGINPRKMKQPVPMADQLIDQARRAQRQGQLTPELEAEMQGELAGAGANVKQTPVGPVPTSPAGGSLVEGI